MCILELQSYSIILKKRQKAEKIAFFYKKVPKNFASFEKSTTFAPAIQNKRVLKTKFGVWCNGNTADSGPAFPGSSPGTPTKKTSEIPINKGVSDFSFSNFPEIFPKFAPFI